MRDVAPLVAAFHEATGRAAAVWERRDPSSAPQLLGASPPDFAARTEAGVLAWDVPEWARTQALQAHLITTGNGVGWLLVEPGIVGDSDRLLQAIIPIVKRMAAVRDRAVHAEQERGAELAMLYAISETLGGATSVENVAESVLQELSGPLGAHRAVFLRARPEQGLLEAVSSVGLAEQPYPPIPFDHPAHIAIRSFQSVALRTDEGDSARLADPVLAPRGEALLAVPVTRPMLGLRITGTYAVASARMDAPGLVPLGVLVLSRAAGAPPFSAGDRSLASAVGRQLGAAVENAALLRAAVEREHLTREMRLAHDLQLRLLSSPTVVAPEARAAARVMPAESVGGDFYLLARLDQHRTGVLIGDVSGHGYPAALVMALALSAAGIHVQSAYDPSVAVHAVQQSLALELASTDMSLSLCYAVIDSRAGELRYANAGHPHAFRLGADGELTRLGAIAPPLGFGEMPLEECVMRWNPTDRLVMFTDGLADARDAYNRRIGEARVLQIVQEAASAPDPNAMLDRVLQVVQQHTRGMPLSDDLALVIVDRPV
ncbi:MAG: GAF domain-containing SpoIIE family protein phosphatase [Gemmatimonadaceae bacterium]